MGETMPRHPKKDTIPLYSRVSSIIQNKIIPGQYEPEEKLPTEDELVRDFQVSKITVRNALALLERDGLIHRIRGKGTYVAKVIPTTKQYIHTSLNKMSLALQRGVNKPLEIKKIKVGDSRIPKDIRAFFNITNGDEIGRIRKMVNIREVLYFFEDFLPVDITTHITKTELAKQKLLLKIVEEQVGLKASKGEMYMQAVPAEPDISKILHCQSFEPLIHIQTYIWSELEEPLGIGNTYFRACYFKYKVKVELNSY
jgi:GntR family transcriptional regulator